MKENERKYASIAAAKYVKSKAICVDGESNVKEKKAVIMDGELEDGWRHENESGGKLAWRNIIEEEGDRTLSWRVAKIRLRSRWKTSCRIIPTGCIVRWPLRRRCIRCFRPGVGGVATKRAGVSARRACAAARRQASASRCGKKSGSAFPRAGMVIIFRSMRVMDLAVKRVADGCNRNAWATSGSVGGRSAACFSNIALRRISAKAAYQ